MLIALATESRKYRNGQRNKRKSEHACFIRCTNADAIAAQLEAPWLLLKTKQK
jgi:hypothetical protein